MQFHLIIVSFHLQLCVKTAGDCFSRLREKKDLMTVRSGAFVAISVYNLVYAYKFDNSLETA